MSKVIIRNCPDYEDEKVKAIIDEVLDTFNVNFKNKNVFMKPNMLAPTRPEKGVTTHPVFIRTLIGALRGRGAKQVCVGDNPGMTGYAENERVARKSGIFEAAGETYKNISGGGDIVNVGGTEVLVSREILDADVIINLPRFKTHTLTLFTGAIKNMFGIIIGNGKVNTHRNFPGPVEFSNIMADICAIRPPELSVLDAVVVMQGNGPNAGSLRKVGKILASPDPVALDATALQMAGIPCDAVPMVGRGKELGLGDYDDIDIDGEVEVIPRFRLPITYRLPKGFIEHVVNRIGCFFASRRIPKLIKKKCTGCKVCVEHCPANALTMEGKYPKLNKPACISCFCCIELCTERAYKLKIKW